LRIVIQNVTIASGVMVVLVALVSSASDAAQTSSSSDRGLGARRQHD
jgi:hypothetical protein